MCRLWWRRTCMSTGRYSALPSPRRLRPCRRPRSTPGRAGEGEARVIEDIRDALIAREGSLFLLTDPDGGIPLNNASGFGLYHSDTRYLSGWDLSLIGVEPIVLLSTADLGFGEEQVMTNPELINENGEILPSGSLGSRRHRGLGHAR